MSRKQRPTSTIRVKGYWSHTSEGVAYHVGGYKREVAISKPAPARRAPVRREPVRRVLPRRDRERAAEVAEKKRRAERRAEREEQKRKAERRAEREAQKRKAERRAEREEQKRKAERRAKREEQKRRAAKVGKRKPAPQKKPPKKPRREPPKKHPKKLPKKRRKKLSKKIPKKYPPFMPQAMKAEDAMLEKLNRMLEFLMVGEPGLALSVKTFINKDATVDGELRIGNLPDEWRTVEGLPSLLAELSSAINGMGAFPIHPSMGGGFWISFAMRFGPKNEQEIVEFARLYKRFRGFFQVGMHYTTANNTGSINNNATGIRQLIETVLTKREIPPVEILVRVVWMPVVKTKRGAMQAPARYVGEEGEKHGEK